MEKARAQCIECGGDAVLHRLTYITVAIDEIIRPSASSNSLARTVAKMVYGIEQFLTPRLLMGAVSLGLAKKQEEPDERTALLALMLWNEAKARGIDMWEWRLFNLPRNIFIARLQNGRVIAFEGIPTSRKDLEREPWMDNKAELKKKFRALGLPIANGGSAITSAGALQLFKTLEPPVIVKPHTGSGSRHTTLHIDRDIPLLKAFAVATQISPSAVIEEELIGPVYRATVVDGRHEATLRRDQPHVIGDGTHTVRELMEKANEHPARNGPYFSKMKIDAAAEQELAWQHHTADSVPKNGERVTLHQKVNWSGGGTTADVTDIVHPDNIALFEEVARVLKAPVVGMDFIIDDITKSYKEQKRAGVIECNSMPFFDNHHLPFEGEPRNVAGAIWDMIEREYRVI